MINWKSEYFFMFTTGVHQCLVFVPAYLNCVCRICKISWQPTNSVTHKDWLRLRTGIVKIPRSKLIDFELLNFKLKELWKFEKEHISKELKDSKNRYTVKKLLMIACFKSCVCVNHNEKIRIKSISIQKM